MSDSRELRNALGKFGTGVTVITTITPGQEPVGLTASSFNAVSLDPPLILWSLASASPSEHLFASASHFAVNVLSLEQLWLSQRFSTPQADKFRGVDWRPGVMGSPLLEGCLARFECSRHACHQGGDHLIIVGRVESFSYLAGDPLLFYSGSYFSGHPVQGVMPTCHGSEAPGCDWAGIG